jgi:heme/copper-type cytochrome/quinol oxidase subunit 2
VLDSSSEEVVPFNVIFDSYLDQDLEETSAFRLLKTDNDVYLPIQTYLRVLVTSTDVIHS